MWNLLLRVRYISLIAVITAFVGSFFMFCIGAKKTFVAIWDYFKDIRPDFVPDHMVAEDIVVGRLIIVLDSFLLAIILLYFGYAIYALFIIKDKEVEKSDFPAWLLPSGVGDLKETLAQVLIVLLFILAVRVLWLGLDKLTWEMLIVPASIVLLAAALKIVGFKKGYK
jgi:uncharacterized membrane protein YqhA